MSTDSRHYSLDIIIMLKLKPYDWIPDTNAAPNERVAILQFHAHQSAARLDSRYKCCS